MLVLVVGYHYSIPSYLILLLYPGQLLPKEHISLTLILP